MKLQSLSEHFSDDSLVQQTHLLSPFFSDNNEGLQFVSLLFLLCVILHSVSLCSFMLFQSPSLCLESIFMLLKQNADTHLDPEPEPLDRAAATFLFCLIYFLNSWFIVFMILISTILLTVCLYPSFSSLCIIPLTFSCFLSLSLSPAPSSNLALLFCQQALFTDS